MLILRLERQDAVECTKEKQVASFDRVSLFFVPSSWLLLTLYTLRIIASFALPVLACIVDWNLVILCPFIPQISDI